MFDSNGTERLKLHSLLQNRVGNHKQANYSYPLGEDGGNDAQGAGIRKQILGITTLMSIVPHGVSGLTDVTGQTITLFGVIEDPESSSQIPYTVDVILTLTSVNQLTSHLSSALTFTLIWTLQPHPMFMIQTMMEDLLSPD